MKKDVGGSAIGLIIPITLIVLTLIALILMNQAHA